MGDIEDVGHVRGGGVLNVDSMTNPVSPASKGSVYVRTFGCAHNQSDSETMAGLLSSDGWSITPHESDISLSDVCLINSCTVKGPSQDAFVNMIRKCQKAGKPVVVAGCVPQAFPKNPIWSRVEGVVGVQQLGDVSRVVESALEQHTHQQQAQEEGSGSTTTTTADPPFRPARRLGLPPLSLPKLRRNALVETIPICVGCRNQCTYCATRFARGALTSYPIEDIVQAVLQAAADGVCEIRLTGEDTGAFGLDRGIRLVDLLRRITEALDAAPTAQTDRCMIRVGQTNPPYVLDQLDDLCAVLQHRNIFRFLHIPVQSGSNKILSDMRRQYTVEEFQHIVDTLRARVPGITLATDIICGFPGETDAEFQESLDLVQRNQFVVVNISQFYPRPRTVAATMPQVPRNEIKQRSRRMTDVFTTMMPLEALPTGHESPTVRVYVCDTASDGVNWVGHTVEYIQVIIPQTDPAIGPGAVCAVQLKSATRFSVMGQVVEVLVGVQTGSSEHGQSESLTGHGPHSVQHERDRSAEPPKKGKDPP